MFFKATRNWTNGVQQAGAAWAIKTVVDTLSGELDAN